MLFVRITFTVGLYCVGADLNHPFLKEKGSFSCFWGGLDQVFPRLKYFYAHTHMSVCYIFVFACFIWWASSFSLCGDPVCRKCLITLTSHANKKLNIWITSTLDPSDRYSRSEWGWMHFQSAVQKGHILEFGGEKNQWHWTENYALSKQFNSKGTVMCLYCSGFNVSNTYCTYYTLSPVKVGHAVSTSRSVCDYFITLPPDNDRFHSAAVGVVSSALTRARYTWQKTKSGTNDLTPPVNSDFSQPVITCSANNCDWLSHTNVTFIRGWWVARVGVCGPQSYQYQMKGFLWY